MYRLDIIIAAAVGLSAAAHSLPAHAYAYDPTAQPVLVVAPSGHSEPEIFLPLIDVAAIPSAPPPAEPSAKSGFSSKSLGLAMVGAGMVAWVLGRRREDEADDGLLDDEPVDLLFR